MSPLTGYADFESILIKSAELEGWQFIDGDEIVGAEVVFNHQTYGPALLRVAEDEIADRGLDEDLGLVFTREPDALMGVEVGFDSGGDAIKGYVQMMWRLALCIHVLHSLPRRGNLVDLTVLYAARFNDLPRPEND